MIGELDGSKLPGATPVRRAALRPYIALFESIEERLLAPEEVSAAGMLAVNDLLASPGSCLFAIVDDVEACLHGVLEKLEVR